jgi:DNA transposition AAA+ family ATPase
MGLPGHLDNLDRKLDKTSYALSLLGIDFLEARMSLTDKREVEDAIKYSQSPFAGGGGGKHAMLHRIVRRWAARQ